MLKNFFKKVSLFLLSDFFALFFLSFCVIFSLLSLFLIFIPSLYFYIFPNVFNFFDNFFHFITLYLKNFFVDSSYNFGDYKVDIDSTTNTDGEDTLSHLNDFTEISLQERAYFFDWIVSNPFEFLVVSGVSYLFSKLVLSDKIKTPSNLFKKK